MWSVVCKPVRTAVLFACGYIDDRRPICKMARLIRARVSNRPFFRLCEKFLPATRPIDFSGFFNRSLALLSFKLRHYAGMRREKLRGNDGCLDVIYIGSYVILTSRFIGFVRYLARNDKRCVRDPRARRRGIRFRSRRTREGATCLL